MTRVCDDKVRMRSGRATVLRRVLNDGHLWLVDWVVGHHIVVIAIVPPLSHHDAVLLLGAALLQLGALGRVDIYRYGSTIGSGSDGF